MAEIEVEIKSESKGCDGNCACGGEMKMVGPKPEETMSKDQLQAVLAGLLAKKNVADPAEHQLKIDELTKKIAEYGQEED